MSTVIWNRLIETCYRTGASVTILTVNSPPLFWTGQGWQSARVDVITPKNLKDLALAGFAGKPDGMADGYFYRDFTFEDATFRLMAFGRPKPNLLVISRFSQPENPHFGSRLI